jgi:hypothetical protein
MDCSIGEKMAATNCIRNAFVVQPIAVHLIFFKVIDDGAKKLPKMSVLALADAAKAHDLNESQTRIFSLYDIIGPPLGAFIPILSCGVFRLLPHTQNTQHASLFPFFCTRSALHLTVCVNFYSLTMRSITLLV